jgi:phospholipid/cholesterol/gamma-HCH transport system substrate-binding protein
MSRRGEVVTGAFSLISVAIIVLMAMWLSGDRWRGDHRVLTAHFETVGQLQPGNDVTVRGVKVGSVESIVFSDRGTVVVRMRLRPDVPLPEDPVVLLQAASLFGDWKAAIVPASSHPGLVRDSIPLPPDEVPGITQADFASLSEHTAEIAANLEGITRSLETALNDETAGQLAQTFENLNRASNELVAMLSDQRANFDSFAEDVSVLSGTVLRSAAALDRTLARVDSATAGGRLDSIVANVETVSSDLGSTAREWRGVAQGLESTLVRLDSTVQEATEILARINRGEGSLGMLSVDTVLYENTAAALSELKSLLYEIKRDPAKYFRVSIF